MVVKKQSPTSRSKSKKSGVGLRWFRTIRTSIQRRINTYLARRPHRSFRRTRRRDYVRSLALPGYWALTFQVTAKILRHKRVFFTLGALYGALTILLVGIGSQETYSKFQDVLKETGGDLFSGSWGEIGQASLLIAASVGGVLNQPGSTDAQNIFGFMLFLLVWLTTVWLLRAQMADKKPRLRDGLYNAGAPIIPLFLVSLVAIVQLLPVALLAVGSGAAIGYGLLDGGVAAMLFTIVAALLSALSLYWLTSTTIAMVVVTLPGMYPLQAIKTAGDVVIGRRVRILLRLLWMVFVVVLAWLLILIPLILFDAWIKSLVPSIAAVPFVPASVLLLGTLTLIWTSAYVYIFYRKVVDDDAAPA